MRRLSVLVVLVLFLMACGGDDDDVEAGDSTTTDPASETTEADTSTPEADTSTTEATSTTTDPPSDGDLPGEVVDIFPYADANLAVVGVDRDDTLAVRAGPSVDYDVVLEFAPTETGIVATGHNRQVGDSFWVEVTKDGATGWANVAYLLQPGATSDITSELADESGELPAAETMVDLAKAVGDLRASDEPPSRIVVVEDPVVGEHGGITVDVIGFGDDAIGGERLYITATPITEAFVVESVQRQVLCSRGVNDDGLCL